MNLVSQRQTLVLYTTAVCNLNCVYCYIDKNPALVKIDQILDESFRGDYYFEFAKEMFPDPAQLKSVEFWGGEPALRLDRAYDTVEKLIGFYPNLTSFFLSTNFVHPEWDRQVEGLIRILQNHPERRFEFYLQLSLDGPEAINDAQRGAGVTKKFQAHFSEYIRLLNRLLGMPGNNVVVSAGFKPTLTSEIVRTLIEDKERIIGYYRFFEAFLTEFQQNCVIPAEYARLNLAVPNTASPSPHTVEDGKEFAVFCRYCADLMRENREGKNHFRYYRTILPYLPRENPSYESSGYMNGCGACGSGVSTIGLLPYDYISCCHNGFVNLITEYKKEAEKNRDSALDFRFFMSKSNYLIRKKQEYHEYEKCVSFAYDPVSSVKLANVAGMISLLAKNGQVSPRFTNTKEAAKAARFLQVSTAYCFRDNIGTTGSAAMIPVGICRLLLNGAMEVIEHGI